LDIDVMPLELIGADLWVMDGPSVRFMGLSLPTRMTIARLSNGDLWVHSPVPVSRDANDALRTLGRIGHIVCPNKFHHLFLSDWITAHPSAQVHAAPGLIVKRPEVHFDAELSDVPNAAWSDLFNQVVFRGSGSFDEVIFFHRPSATAIFTDLIVNLPLEGQGFVGRLIARLDGVAYPNGGTPRLFQLSMRDRRLGRKAVDVVLAWEPNAAVISHGEWFRKEARQTLAGRFNWLRA
jgi:hypothetical protein